MDELSPPIDRETTARLRPGDHKAELRLWLRMLTCATLIEGGVRRKLRDSFDVTLPRFDLMAQLDKTPDGLTLGELSRRMMVSNGNITAIVDALVAQGLVTRTPSTTDRRAQVVALSADGRAAFRRMAAAHEDWIARTFAGLSPADIDQLMALLGRAKASARNAFQGGAA
jgi:DNA-binding MarR family transcriptional regulator